MSTLTADPHMLPGCVGARRLACCRNGYISSRHAVMFRLAAPPRAVMRVRLAAWLTRPVASPGCSGGLLRQTLLIRPQRLGFLGRARSTLGGACLFRAHA